MFVFKRNFLPQHIINYFVCWLGNRRLETYQNLKQVSENLISIYLDEYDETPWDALKYLIADVNYGGHVTDDIDRRLLRSYVENCFKDETINTPFFKFNSFL